MYLRDLREREEQLRTVFRGTPEAHLPPQVEAELAEIEQNRELARTYLRGAQACLATRVRWWGGGGACAGAAGRHAAQPRRPTPAAQCCPHAGRRAAHPASDAGGTGI